jgi:hypothetical protein
MKSESIPKESRVEKTKDRESIFWAESKELRVDWRSPAAKNPALDAKKAW